MCVCVQSLVGLREEEVILRLERECLEARDECSSLLRGETKLRGSRLHVDIKERGNEARRSTKAQLEGRETSGSVDSVHELESNVWQGGNPTALLTGDVVSQHLNDRAVGAFAGAVCFGVVCQGEFNLDSGETVQGFPETQTKSLSRSEIMSVGKPFSQYQCTKNSVAKSSAEMSVRQGTSRMSEPRRHVMVAIQSKPSSSGSRPTKSMATLSPQPSGTGNGWRGPTGLTLSVLFR